LYAVTHLMLLRQLVKQWFVIQTTIQRDSSPKKPDEPKKSTPRMGCKGIAGHSFNQDADFRCLAATPARL
jgi:hypothetical protein